MPERPRVVRSSSNPGVKRVVKLRSARARRDTGLFPVEGFREVRRALHAGIDFEQLWFCEDLFLGAHERGLLDAAEARGIDTVACEPGPFSKMAYRDRPEGLIGVCRMFDTSLDRLTPGPRALLLVVEAIEKPGNLGTMIRAAGAAGVDGVIVCDPATDIFNPNVVRSSIGTVFTVPVAVATTQDTRSWLRARRIAVCAASPVADAAPWDVDLRQPTALVVGSEQYGLTTSWLEGADHRVGIPMPGEAIDSLNASASAAVLLFEAVRQRSR